MFDVQNLMFVSAILRRYFTMVSKTHRLYLHNASTLYTHKQTIWCMRHGIMASVRTTKETTWGLKHGNKSAES